MREQAVVKIHSTTKVILDMYFEDPEVKANYRTLLAFIDSAVREKIERDTGVSLSDLVKE